MKPLIALNEKINAAKHIIDNLNTAGDYEKYGFNENHCDAAIIRGIFDTLKAGGEVNIACINIKNFFDRFGIETEERGQNNFIIKPKIKGVQTFECEPWYADLCLLLDEGYCVSKKEYKHSIFKACKKLEVQISYRNYFGRDYFVICGEFEHYNLKRHDCLAYCLENTKSELTKYSQDCGWETPRPGFFKEWSAAAFRYERLRQMLDEIYRYHSGFDKIMKVYVGTIGGYGSRLTKTENPHPFITHVNFDVDFTSNTYSGLNDSIILDIDHDLGIEWFINGYHDVERHRRYDEGKDTTLRAYVDSINVIRRLEWIEP